MRAAVLPARQHLYSAAQHVACIRGLAFIALYRRDCGCTARAAYKIYLLARLVRGKMPAKGHRPRNQTCLMRVWLADRIDKVDHRHHLGIKTAAYMQLLIAVLNDRR